MLDFRDEINDIAKEEDEKRIAKLKAEQQQKSQNGKRGR